MCEQKCEYSHYSFSLAPEVHNCLHSNFEFFAVLLIERRRAIEIMMLELMMAALLDMVMVEGMRANKKMLGLLLLPSPRHHHCYILHLINCLNFNMKEAIYHWDLLKIPHLG